MIGALVLNGERYIGQIIGDYVVCCDGGYDKSDRCDCLIGDMDSIAVVPHNVKAVLLNPDKDLTDGEAGVNYLIDTMGVDSVIIYGLDGGRLDHILANIALMAIIVKKGVSVIAKCNGFDAYMTCGKIELQCKKNSAISLSPFSDEVHIMSTKGLKFNIYNFILNKASTLSYSNTVLSDNIIIEVASGLCMVIVNK